MAAEALATLKFPIEVYDTLKRYYEFGQFIYDRIQTYHKAPEIVQEIQAFMEDMKGGVLASQIEIVEWMYQQPDIDEFTRRRVETLLKQLKSELLLLDDLLVNSFDKHGNLHKMRFTVTYQSKLNQSMATLKVWKVEFWAEAQVLQTRRSLIPNPLLLSPPKNFKPHSASWVKCPELGSMFWTGEADFQAKNGKWRTIDVLVEDLTNLARLTNSGRAEKEQLEEAKAIAIELVKTMSPSNANVLTCLGYRDNPVQLIFEYPHGFNNPQTLRNLILTSKRDTEAPPLEYRFRLVQELVDAVFLVLTAKPLNSKLPPGYVHKNIRPSSIVIFSPRKPLPADATPETVWTSRSKAYLTDWRKLRQADQGSYRESDNLWTMNFYRHYNRQGVAPQDRYEMKHDLYSLAICLLEVGLWETFITVDGQQEVMSEFFVKEALRIPDVTQEDLEDRNGFCATTTLRDIFVSIADRHLPQAMGTPLTQIVKRCLKEEIEGAGDFGGDSNLAALGFQNLISKAVPQF